VSPARPQPRIEVAPYDFAAARELSARLGVSHVLAQVLVRRGFAAPAEAAAFLAAEESHPASAFAGIERAVESILGHVRAGRRIVVHGDYDVDGVSSTAVLVRCLRRLGAHVGWFLPSRMEDGYGLSPATVRRLAERGTGLLVTVDCAITAVEEVAAARAAGLEVVVTDHHRPRPDGALPAAPIVHPTVGGYPCPDLCATAVAAKLADALEDAAGVEPRALDDDADLVALATVADCVPLRGENRALVRRGLRVLAGTAKPGLRALMRVAQVDPGALDARALGFRLAPRINAAGRLHRADAGLELLLTEDEARAEAVAAELDAANVERRHVETRILFEAEAQVAEAGERPAYVLAGDGWHPGVIGIVASRIAERHHRPAVLVALDGERGTGSGRSIPGYDLLAGLTAAGDRLRRFGGHRAAAGLELERVRLDDFRAAFEAHAAAALGPEDLVPVERVDAVVPGDALDLELAEELERLAPFGTGNPEPVLLVPAATLTDPVAMGEGKHVRFTVQGGGARSRAVAFGGGARLPVDADVPVDATFALERNAWNGAVEPRLVLRAARPCEPDPIEVLGEPARWWEAVLAELDAPLPPWPPEGQDSPAAPAGGPALGGAVLGGPSGGRTVVDRRDRGLAGTLADVAATGEPVLVVCADAWLRRRGLQGRLGGFALCSRDALEREPGLAARFPHVVALDPPAHAGQRALLAAGAGGYAHLAWGNPELRFAHEINAHHHLRRDQLVTLYRALRDRGGGVGEELRAALQEHSRSPTFAGRALRVLEELGLVQLDRVQPALTVPAAERTELERSPAFREYQRRLQDADRYLSEATPRAA
jgi:single-stranded-DNA-specific exonuclease